MNTRIRVLVVDDSAFARKVMREVLSRDPAIEVVGIARDGLEALEKVAELSPDVMTLDLVMPDLDGVGVLRALPETGAPRVIIVSASSADSDIAIEALQLGAVDLVSKPTPLPTDRLYELARELIEKVKVAYGARSTRIVASEPLPSVVSGARSSSACLRLVVIGTSTGGPQALTELFKGLDKDLPTPLAIALHIPHGYTASLAARLTKLGGPPVDEASDGMELVPGRAVISPGGMHLSVVVREGRIYAKVSREPVAKLHHPSVDLLFESAAEQLGADVLGLVMTGMGNDGTLGAQAIRKAGGRVFVESARSCIVYGMPRSVVEAGASDGEAPLIELSGLLNRSIHHSARSTVATQTLGY